MSTQARELSTALKIKEKLSIVLAPLTVVQSSDANGVMLLVSDGTPAAGEQVAAIRLCKMPSDFTDSVGLTQKIYAPLICQVIEETSTIAATSLLTAANRSKLDAILAQAGLRQERYMTANATVPATSMFAANAAVTTATAVATIEPDIQWPLSGQ
jgi:hypothetical protein